MHFKKVHYFTFDLNLRSRTNTKHCPVSYTSYDLCTCKVWSYYVQWFRRNCIYKKYLIWLYPRSRSHEALPSTPCHLCTYKDWCCYGQLLWRCITKKKHYLILTPRSRESRSHKVLPSTLDFMWPMYQQSLMLIHPDAFTRKYIICPRPWGQGHTKYCPVPFTSCDLSTSKVWYCYIPRFRRRCIYKKMHYLTLT